jgi:hypothetical protein
MFARQFATVCLVVITLVTATWADEKTSNPLPLSKVVLFNAGVGFYQHDAEITGDQTVELKFNVTDINDLLKSMVLQDLGGGKVSTVTYNSLEPITKTLKTFAVDLTQNPTLFDLLGQLRGERIEVESPGKVVGVILGLERRAVKTDDATRGTQQAEFINLLTDDGIRSYPLATLSRIKLLNERIDGELRQALLVLAMGNSTDKKTVTLNFLGSGKRPVRVGYVQESPVWKTSYRLVLDDQAPPFLQGWAIVENTTEQDWKDIKLTLVSGRPISFVMDLYQPLYVPRPVVETELFASLRPQTYGQDMDRANREFAEAAKGQLRDLQAGAARKSAAAAPGAGLGGGANANAAGERRMLGTDKLAEKQSADGFFARGESLARSVQSAADAGNVGEMFQYAIDSPVTLPRQQSAMIPIVNASVTGEKVSIYNPGVHAKHPLNGLRMKNSTGLHLMQGPITVFDDGAYAGDARIEDLPPNSERLISYAMDLDTEVALETRSTPDQMVSVKIVKGTLWSSRKPDRTQTYTIKNSGKKAKKVLIEQPLDASWKLITPEKPSEKTRDRYRFDVQAEPGVPAKLVVNEEQTVQQQVGMSNFDNGAIQIYLSQKVVSEAVKAALQEVVRRKSALDQAQRAMNDLQNQIKVIDQEQARIRQNMQQLDRNSALYTRYVTKFAEQEDQVEKLRDQIEQAGRKLEEDRRSLDSYLLSLNVQ